MAAEDGTKIRRNFDNPDETRPFAKGRVEVVEINGVTVMRGTFEPGWTWSACIKPVVGGERCQVSHKWYVVSGRMKMRMDDGTELEWGAGDVGWSRQGMTPGLSVTRRSCLLILRAAAVLQNLRANAIKVDSRVN
jgi:uncharacterized cupin superfamily protein